jgi:hypothetical protein
MLTSRAQADLPPRLAAWHRRTAQTRWFDADVRRVGTVGGASTACRSGKWKTSRKHLHLDTTPDICVRRSDRPGQCRSGLPHRGTRMTRPSIAGVCTDSGLRSPIAGCNTRSTGQPAIGRPTVSPRPQATPVRRTAAPRRVAGPGPDGHARITSSGDGSARSATPTSGTYVCVGTRATREPGSISAVTPQSGLTAVGAQGKIGGGANVGSVSSTAQRPRGALS